MSYTFRLVLACVLVFSAGLWTSASALQAGDPSEVTDFQETDLNLSPGEEARLDQFLLQMDHQIKAQIPEGAMGIADDISHPINPGDYPGDINFPTDPTDSQPYDPTTGSDYFPFPSTSRTGASEKVALEVLFQTFMFYGVTHILEKKGTQIDFKVIRSKYNYFTDITKIDIAYAIREFARYLNAHLCGQATMQNFYRAFAQVPAEEIGLRFKYDMAWALLGNSLPREANQVMKLGTRWKALDQILSTTSVLRTPSSEPTDIGSAPIGKAGGQIRELRSWATSIRDVVNVLTRLNKLLCYVDIRPNPKEELKKRVVVGKILEMGRRLTERYSEFKELLDQVNKQGKSEQISNIRKN